MKILTHPVALALGISTLCLLFLIGPFISPNHSLIYHLSSPATPLFVEAGIYFGYFWLLVTGILLMAEKYHKIWLPVWLGIVLFLPWGVLKDIIMLEQWEVPHWIMVLLFLLLLGFFTGGLFFLRAELERIFPPIQRLTSVLLGFAALSGVALVVQYGWCAWEARGLNPPLSANLRSISPPDTPTRRRVIWILFDELSYQQVYEQRFPGLSLPAFDRLAKQSVIFTHVVPAGTSTEHVIPSLFSGLTSDEVRVSADGRLASLHNPATGTWLPFTEDQTVFQDARLAGYANGIAGWYNPYCRLLPEVLDRCFWAYRNPDLRYFESVQTGKARITSPFRFLASYVRSLLGITAKTTPIEINAEVHIGDYEEIRDAADRLLTDPSIDFVFLHLPVPHPPGIYDRERMKFVTTGSSYLGNLALADQCLAHARLLLEQQHQWDSSMVVIMGDHSWRAPGWKSAPGWTPEDEQASDGGQFDDRPGYIVKMPMQDTALRVDARFPAVNTRALLDAVIGNKLQTGEELKVWAEQHR
jgi:hypothetical protein